MKTRDFVNSNLKIIFSICLACVFANYLNAQEPDFSLARIGKKTQGIYIFINAEPVQAYDFIATMEVSDFWTRKTPQEAYERLIIKSKKKYPNFNGIIFHNDNFHKADLIKFKSLEISGGGFHVGDKITTRDKNKIIYGEIISINNTDQEATFKYTDEFNSERNQIVKYVKLQPLSLEEYDKAIKNAKPNKRIFSVGQMISWTEFNKIKYGIIQELDAPNHKSVIKYLLENGQEKTKTKSFEDIFPANETDYNTFVNQIQTEVKKHQFQVGDKVKWIRNTSIVHGIVLEYNDSNKKTSIKYFTEKNEEKIVSVDAFDLIKDE